MIDPSTIWDVALLVVGPLADIQDDVSLGHVRLSELGWFDQQVRTGIRVFLGLYTTDDGKQGGYE
jgi:hypothetical protein